MKRSWILLLAACALAPGLACDDGGASDDDGGLLDRDAGTIDDTGDGGASECRSDGQCPAGRICEQEHCVDGCRSGRDCPVDRPLCDPTRGAHGGCVACIAPTDCDPGQSCEEGVCQVVCSGDLDCPGQRCDPDSMRCVACLSSGDCPLGSICSEHACLPGCAGDRDCPPELPRCDDSADPNGACVACLDAADCGPSGYECHDHACVAVCSDDDDCPGAHCDTAASVCVACLSNEHCPLGSICADHDCVPGCDGDRDCPVSAPRCDTTAEPDGACVDCLGDGDCGGGRCENHSCVGTDPGETVAIAAGDFIMGTSDLNADNPRHVVTTWGYAIDRTEVTNSRYALCVDQGGCTAPSGLLDWRDPAVAQRPVVSVTWSQAAAFCRWAGKRLPTEAEWEKAARGPAPSERLYAWGDAPATCALTNAALGVSDAQCQSGVVAVGSYPAAATPTGILDLTGNAREWTFDWYSALSSAAATNPVGPATGTERMTRGGSYLTTAPYLTVSTRVSRPPETAEDYIGFRCATGPALAVPPQAAFTVTPTSGDVGTLFTVDASASADETDPPSALQVRWDWQSDGIFDTAFSTSKTATHSYAARAAYTITLEVRNSSGQVGSASHVVGVGGGDGTPCPSGTECAAGFVCTGFLTGGVCRQDCSVSLDLCVAPYTCQPTFSGGGILLVCLPP